jgi:aspartyl-tRNA(Asn)/glutamyl-tRNA(Gln) amidotransferase subunit A
MTFHICDLTVAELLEGYRSRSFGPVDAIEAVFAAIDRVDGSLNSVMSTRRKTALKEAGISAQKWRAGSAGSLEGVPVGIKDVIDVAGMATTAGSRYLLKNVPAQNAEVIRRLQAAGAIVVAKLATSPFAFADPYTRDFAPARNPWDLKRYTGGTSTGPAAALAARILPLAIGTDSAGSVRIPASHSGITGMKPTYGAISRYGVIPGTHSLDTVGVMARSAADVRLALPVLTGSDHRDPAARVHIRFPQESTLTGMRIGVLRGRFTELCTPAAMSSYEQSLDVLSNMGCELVDLELPMVEAVEHIAWPILATEFASTHEALEGKPIQYGDSLKAFLDYGRAIPATDYIRCLKMRVVLLRAFCKGIAGVDVLVSPTTQAVAPTLDTLVSPTRHGEAAWFDFAAKNTVPFSLAGMPAISVPIALADLDLPFGLQIAAGPGRDADVTRVAAEFQARTDFHRALPKSPIPEAAPTQLIESAA